MTIPAVDPGDLLDLARTFTAADPDAAVVTVTVTCTLLDPDGATHSATLNPPIIDGNTVAVTGTYQLPDTVATSGRWAARWKITGDLVATDETVFWVRQSVVLNT